MESFTKLKDNKKKYRYKDYVIFKEVDETGKRIAYRAEKLQPVFYRRTLKEVVSEINKREKAQNKGGEQ